MEPPALIEHTLTSSGANPNDFGCITERCGDLFTTYRGPLISVENCGNMRVQGCAVLL